jgi:hypothetical protein
MMKRERGRGEILGVGAGTWSRRPSSCVSLGRGRLVIGPIVADFVVALPFAHGTSGVLTAAFQGFFGAEIGTTELG